MFSDELEMLIDAAIADGEISEKERAILHKRAHAEGVDPDELDMIVDARILKAKKAQAVEKVDNKVDEKKEKKSALKLHLEQLDEISKRHFQDIGGSFWNDTDDKSADKQREEETVVAIKSFYVPKDKEELIELINFLKPYAKLNMILADNDTPVNRAYKKRYKEVCEKANVFFPGDPDIDLAINGPKKEKKGFFGFGKKS